MFFVVLFLFFLRLCRRGEFCEEEKEKQMCTEMCTEAPDNEICDCKQHHRVCAESLIQLSVTLTDSSHQQQVQSTGRQWLSFTLSFLFLALLFFHLSFFMSFHPLWLSVASPSFLILFITICIPHKHLILAGMRLTAQSGRWGWVGGGTQAGFDYCLLIITRIMKGS